MNFRRTLQLIEEKQKPLGSTILGKVAKSVRATMPKKPADKWDDPFKFLSTLVKAIESQGYEVSESELDRFRSLCKNRRSDVYIDVDKASQSISFVDPNTGKVGYVHVAVYNDPGKNQDSNYECNYYFG